jgi:hypothetical protein
MINKVIYYPYINVPKSDWFTKAILYWDSVTSIVPKELEFNPNILQPHMRKLIDFGLVKTIDPSELIQRMDEFNEKTYNIISSHMQRGLIQNRDFNSHNSSKIHISKMNYTLFQKLERHGLAIIKETNWYRVEKRTSALYMYLLALTLGYLNSEKSIPITDSQSYFTYVEKSESALYRGNVRVQLLETVFPYPLKDIPVEDIAKFKQKYNNKLILFRKHIEKLALDISTRPSSEERDEFIEYQLAEIKDGILAISDNMKTCWGKIAYSIMTIATPCLEFIGSCSNQDIFAMIASAGGIILPELDIIKNYLLNNKSMASPLEYAAIVKRKFK